MENKYNAQDYLTFAKNATDKDYELMNDLLAAAKDYFLGKAKLNIGLSLWEGTQEAEELVAMGVCLADSPLKACIKTIEYLSANYGLRVFNGDSESDEDIKQFCQQSVMIPFAERQR